MTPEEAKIELQKCIEDPLYFAEKYLTVNGQTLHLRDVDKDFIRWYSSKSKKPNHDKKENS